MKPASRFLLFSGFFRLLTEAIDQKPGLKSCLTRILDGFFQNHLTFLAFFTFPFPHDWRMSAPGLFFSPEIPASITTA
jgi:hypothetical protein